MELGLVHLARRTLAGGPLLGTDPGGLVTVTLCQYLGPGLKKLVGFTSRRGEHTVLEP